jgi:hypothetical protein
MQVFWQSTVLKEYGKDWDLIFCNSYVDEIISCIKKKSNEPLLTDLNNFNRDLYFTFEIMENG